MKKQLDGVFHIYRPGQNEEVTAEEGQVITETLRLQHGALQPYLEGDRRHQV